MGEGVRPPEFRRLVDKARKILAHSGSRLPAEIEAAWMKNGSFMALWEEIRYDVWVEALHEVFKRDASKQHLNYYLTIVRRTGKPEVYGGPRLAAATVPAETPKKKAEKSDTSWHDAPVFKPITPEQRVNQWLAMKEHWEPLGITVPDLTPDLQAILDARRQREGA